MSDTECPAKNCATASCDLKSNHCVYTNIQCNTTKPCYTAYCDAVDGKCKEVKDTSKECCSDTDCPSSNCKVGKCDLTKYKCTYTSKVCPPPSNKCYTTYCDEKDGQCKKQRSPGCCWKDKDCYSKDKCQVGYCDKKTYKCMYYPSKWCKGGKGGKKY